MAAAAAQGEGPLRFKCPPDFSASPFCPRSPFSRETLQSPSKELWLIRAPASFMPWSLDGHSVPLLGFRTLTASQADGTEKTIRIQTAREHLGGAHLLLPSGSGDHLLCSPPFTGSLSLCERYVDPGSDRPLFPVVARPAPQIPAGLKQRFQPFAYHPKGAAEDPPRKKKKKKKPPPKPGEENTEAREATGAGKARGQGPQVDGAALVTEGSQPAAAADVQNEALLSGEPEGLASLSKITKRRKRKADRAQEEETQEEAQTDYLHGVDGTAPSATSPQPSVTADANNSLFGEAEAAAPREKKKKKERKGSRDLQGEVGEETEAPCPQEEDGPAWWAFSPSPGAQPTSAMSTHDTFPSREAEDAAPRRKKKKRKEGRERKEEMGGQAEASSLLQADGTRAREMGSQADTAARDGLLSGWLEDPDSLRKKKKKKEKRKEETGREIFIFPPSEEHGTLLGEASSQPSSTRIAHDSLLSGETEEPASAGREKRRRRRREGQEGKQEPEALLNVRPGPRETSEPPGGDRPSPGEGGAQATHKGARNRDKAVPPEPFCSQEDTAGPLWDTSGPGLASAEEEEPEAGGSSHKAKKKKRKKEKEKPEAAQQGAESWAVLGTPLGGGQEAKPVQEELNRKHKKKGLPRGQAAEKGLEEEVGNP